MVPPQDHLNVKTNNPTKYDKIPSYGVKVTFTKGQRSKLQRLYVAGRRGKHGELKCFRRVSSYLSTSITRRIAV